MMEFTVFKQVPGSGLSRKDLNFSLHAKGYNYLAYGASFPGYDLSIWINEEPSLD